MNFPKMAVIAVTTVLAVWFVLSGDRRIKALRSRSQPKESQIVVVGKSKVAKKVAHEKSGDIDAIDDVDVIEKPDVDLVDEDYSPDADSGETPSLISKKVAGYYGELKNDLPDGKGLMIYKNGEKYEGAWRLGQRHGFGIFWFASGQKYSGMWCEGKMDGDGAYILADGSQYYGEMKKNAISGQGECRYENGSQYKGAWREGKWHGCGLYSLADGRSVTAYFLNQQIIKQFETTEDCRRWKEGGVNQDEDSGGDEDAHENR